MTGLRPARDWLRKYYVQGSDEAHFDLMPATEKAAGLAGNAQRTQFRRYGIALAHAVRIAQADERRERDESAGAHRRTAKAARRDRRGNSARALRRPAGRRQHGAEGSFPAISPRSRVNCLIFVKWSITFLGWIGACASASPCGRGPRARCWKRSWASAMPSPIRIRARASAPSGF